MPKKVQLQFHILTLFPNFFDSPLKTSLLGKAIENSLISVEIHNLRESGVGPHKQVDDRPFGGGPGMVLKPDVLANGLEKILKKAQKPHVVLLDPAGKVFNQKKAEEFSKKETIVLIAAHYEGVDERFKEKYVDEEISIGDYILSGGEVASLVILESTSRLIPGFLGKEESAQEESFSTVAVEGKERLLLDYPVYTRPEIFKGLGVPEVLLSGNHQKIRDWKNEQRIERTKKRRPDLLEN